MTYTIMEVDDRLVTKLAFSLGIAENLSPLRRVHPEQPEAMLDAQILSQLWGELSFHIERECHVIPDLDICKCVAASLDVLIGGERDWQHEFLLGLSLEATA